MLILGLNGLQGKGVLPSGLYRGGSAQKGYLFSVGGISEGGDFTS